MGLQGAQAYRQQSLANATQQEALLPFQIAKTREAEQAVAGQNNPNLPPLQQAGDQALAANLISPGMGATLYANNPQVVAQKTLAEALNQLQKIPANERAIILSKALGIQAQGQLPPGTRETQNGAVKQMPGAPAAMVATAYNSSLGKAAADYPYQAARTIVHRTPGSAAAPLGPPPATFVPMTGAPQQPNPAALRAQVGVMQGMSGTPQNAPTAPVPNVSAAGAPPPAAPAPVAGAPAVAPPVAPNPAATAAAMTVPGMGPPIAPGQSGSGGETTSIFGPGLSPAAYAFTTAQAKQAVQTYGDYQKQMEDSKDMLAQVRTLWDASSNFAPGQFAEARIKWLQWMQSAGLITPAKMNELGSAQDGAKMSIQLQSAFTRSLGSREAAQIFSTLGRGVPNLTMSPDGFAKVSAYMAGMARYNAARAMRAQQYYNAKSINGVNSVRAQYLANSNPSYFIVASAPPAVQREMIASMGANAESFLRKWAKAAAAGWAPEPQTYGGSP
jgi:hypothetical protein